MFTWRDLLLPVVVAAVVGAAARLLTAPRARHPAAAPNASPPPSAGRAAGAVMLVLVGAAVALGASPLVLLDGLRQGPREILGASLPAPAEPSSLAVPYLLTVVAAYAGVALSADRAASGRTAGAATEGRAPRSAESRTGAGGRAEASSGGRASRWRGGRWVSAARRWWRAVQQLRPLAPMAPSLGLLLAGLSFGGTDGLARASWVPLAWAGLVLVMLGPAQAPTWTGRRPVAAGGLAPSSEDIRGGPGADGRNGRSASGQDRPAAGAEGGEPGVAGLDQQPGGGPGGAGRGRWFRVLAGAAMAGVAVLVAVPVSGVVPVRDDEARLLLPRSASPADQPGQSNPLGRVTAFHDGPDDPLFVAETSAPVSRWRLAVLDRYDGVSWSSTAVYRTVGRELPAAPEPPDDDAVGAGQRVEQEVELVAGPEGGRTGDLPWGRWLPVADRAVELGTTGVLFDQTGGTAVVAAGQPIPEAYEVVSEVREPDADLLAAAQAPPAGETTTDRQLPPDIPAELAEMARQIVENTRGESDYAIARAIQDRLMGERFRLVTTNPPGGHTLGHLARFVASAAEAGGDPAADPATGSVEQFVATFAVVARLAGLPSRVVVGFHGDGVAGRHEVSTHRATAWVEVNLARLGWVVFDPVPDATEFVPTPDEPTLADDGPLGPVSTLPEAGADDEADRAGRDGSGGDGGAAPRWVLAGGLVALIVLVVGGAVTPGLVRWWRRGRRRRAPSPVAAVVGGWLTAVDELRAAGVDASASLAVTDVVRRGREGLGPVADPLVPLGALANRCRFGGLPVTDEHAHRAWELCDRFVAARRRGRPVGQRLREHFGLRESPAKASRSSPPEVT